MNVLCIYVEYYSLVADTAAAVAVALFIFYVPNKTKVIILHNLICTPINPIYK